MRTSLTQRLAVICSRHPWRTVGAWLALLLLAMGSIAFFLGSALVTEGNVTAKPDSVKGFDLLEDRFPGRDAVTELVVVRSVTGTAADPAFRAQVDRLRRQIGIADGVVNVADPYAPAAEGLVSQDGDAVLVPVVMDDAGGADPATGVLDVIDAVQALDADDGVSAAVTGDWTLNQDFMKVSQHDLEKGEMQFGLPAALIVLLLVFGAVVAALVPLAMAVVSIVVALGIAGVVGLTVDLSFFIVNMVVAMGLALGIDYTLFVASRYREERHVGGDRPPRSRCPERLPARPCSSPACPSSWLFSGCSWCPTPSCAASPSVPSWSVWSRWPRR